jgi:hypothetical protein
MGDLFGDAFAEDSAHRFFGRDIFDQNSQLSFPDSGDLAVSKSNNVSFLKVDDLDPDLRNILVVGESFICYSVTAKRTSIRAIDTVSGEKALLKGHESSILDLKLSVSDSQTFCSVDCGADTSKSHVFVWKRADGKSLDFKLVLQSKLSAKMVQSFPKGDAWGISDGRRIGILTSENASATQYNQLPYYISVDDGVITEFSFSPTGDHVAALVSIDRDVQYTQIWRLLDSGRVEKVSPNFWRVSNAVALVFLSEFIVTVSRDNQSSQGSRDSMNTIPYAVNLWSTADLFAGGVPASPPRNIQTLLLHVPEYRFRGKSTSLINPSLECDLRLEPNNGRYLILSSRKSNVLACLALSASGSSALPIYHVTYLDFKAPIVSMDIATILGREHHSSEEGEHVEVTAYQEEAADQSSIQQYHVLVKSLFDFSKYGAPSSSPAHGSVSPLPAASSNNSPHGHPSAAASTIVGMLNRAPGASSSPSILPSKGSFSSTVGTPSAGDNLVRTVPKSQQGSSSNSSQLEYTPTALTADKSALDALQSRSVADAAATKNTASTPATPRNAMTDAAVVSELPDFLRAAATPKSHNSILSAFNRTNIHHNNSASASAGANGLSAILSAEKPPAALSFAAVASSNVSNVSNAPTSTATSNSSTSASKPSTVTTQAPVASTAGVSGGKKLLSSLTTSTPASATSAATSSGTVEPSTIASPGAASSTPVVASGPTKNLLSILGKATTSPPPVVPASPATHTPSTPMSSSVHTTVNSGELKQDLLREMHHLHTVTMTEMRTLLHQQHQVTQRNMQDLMAQTKMDLTNQLTETLTNKVQQQLSNKLKESMRDTIRDSMRSYLQDAFRNAFESSLLPAFQSGIDRMFEQVNSSVDDGMDGVLTVLQEQHQEAVDARAQIVSQVSEAAATLMKDRNNTVSDNNSVGVTPEMIGSMMKAMINVETMWKRTEQTVSQLQEMMAQMQSMLVAGGSLENAGMQVGAIIQANRKPTADELLSQGKIAEAIICALDNKNIDETVAVLAKLSPAVVNQKCSPLVRLCITQQLASDLSVNAPSEGIAKRLEWIKSLVATIVRIPKPEFDANVNLKRNFPSMIQAVLESIQAAKGWIARAQYDNGEDDDATVDIPHSVHTDLELLEIVVQTASW